MKKTIYTLLLLLPALGLFAEDRSFSEMQEIASYKLFGVKSGSIQNKILKLLKDENTYSVFGTSDKGFVIVSKNDACQPVLAYSEQQFPTENVPCGLKWWLSNIGSSTSSTMNCTAGNRTSADDTFQPEAIPVLMSTKWGQGDPYNYMCPVIDNAKAPTGCVATAMAQIMNYYRYPVKGEGLGYYTMGDNEYRQLVEINSTYKWDLMKDSYANSWFITDEEKEAIGQLMYDAGVGAHMNYKSGGSGTTGYVAGHAFAEIFQFDSLTIKCIDREYCESDNVWMNTILNELKAKRPILMCGQDDAQGGHAFVIDGMDADGYVHVNWGWNGDGDGYYSLLDLSPTNAIGEPSTMHFNSSQSIVTNLRCNPIPADGAVYESKWVISAEDNLLAGEMNSLNFSAPDAILWQYSHLTFYGKVGLAFLDSNGKEVFFHTFFDTSESSKGLSPVEGGNGYYASYFSLISAADLAGLPAGTYRTFLASEAVQETQPRHICYPGGKYKEYIVTKAADKSLTVTPANPSGIEQIHSANAISPSRFFDLQGREVNANTKGMIIRRQGSEVKKVMAK